MNNPSQPKILLHLIDYIEENWPTAKGLIAIIIFFLIIESMIFSLVKFGSTTLIILYLLTVIIVAIIWYYLKTPRKTKRGKIGFVVSIHCAKEETREKVHEDFINTIRTLIKAGKTGRTFHFIEIPQHISKNVIDVDDAQKLRLKCNAHFLLYGRVRIRDFQGKHCHFFDLNGIVSHKQVPIEVSAKLSKEFSELLFKRVVIAPENDLLAFDFTSEWIDVVARYIIGIAALISGDTYYSEQLFHDVQDRLVNLNKNFPVFKKLNERTPVRLAEIYSTRAADVYEKWKVSHDMSLIDKMGEFLDKISEQYKHSQKVMELLAIYTFLKTRNADKSINVLELYKEHVDFTWHINYAFLLAYKKDWNKMLKHLDLSLLHNPIAEIILQTEEFACWLLEEEPDKYHLYYYLGALNEKIKGDKIQAIKDYEKFLKNASNKKYSLEKGKIKIRVSILKKEMK